MKNFEPKGWRNEINASVEVAEMSGSED